MQPTGTSITPLCARGRRSFEVSEMAQSPLPASAQAPELGDVRRQLRDTLLRFDRQGALGVYDRLGHLPPERRAEDVLLPVMREIGDLWQDARAVVAQEHFASGFVREKLAEMIGELDTGVAPGPEGVCAGAPGDQHELGLMACAVRLASAGWKVLYLGADVPIEELRRVVAERRPALLCTSVVVRQDPASFRAFAERLRGMAPRETAVVIGGSGVPADTAPVDGVRFASCLGEIFSAN